MNFFFLNRLPFEVAACVPCQRRALAHVRANAAINHHKARLDLTVGPVGWVGFKVWFGEGGFPPQKRGGMDNPNHLNGKWPDPPSGR